MNRDEWDAICRKCGKCCYEKVDLGGGVIRYTEEPCEYLDTSTRLCKIFDKRHELEPDCISLTEPLVRQLWWLPEDCAYLEYVQHQDTLAEVRIADERARKNRRAKRRR